MGAGVARTGDPRRHHFLPVFYQSGFSERDDGLLWVYDRAAGRDFEAHPRALCFERNLYTIFRPGAQDQRVETDLTSRLDSQAAAAIRQLGSPEWPTPKWGNVISEFAALLQTRSPAFRRVMLESHRLLAEARLGMAFSDDARARTSIARYESATGERFGCTAESMVEAVSEGRIRVHATERPFLEYMFKEVSALAGCLLARAWVVIEAPSRAGFITSDYPLVVVPAPGSRASGPAAPGCTVLLPLNRRYCLRTAEGAGLSVRTASPGEIERINQNVALSSERFVMGASRCQILEVTRSSGTARPERAPRGTVLATRSERDQWEIRAELWPRRPYLAV